MQSEASSPAGPNVVTVLERSAAPAAPEPGATELRDRVLAASLMAMIAEGYCAGHTTATAHAGAAATIFAGLDATAFLALPVACLALPLAWLLGRPEVLSLGRHVRAGLGGGDGNGPLGIVLFAALLGVGVTLPAWLGGAVADHLSPRFTMIGTTTYAFCWIFAAAAVAAVAVRFVAWPLRFAARFLRWVPRPIDLCVAVVGVAALVKLAPMTHAITPAAAVVGFAFGPWMARLGVVRKIVRASGVLLVAAAAVLTPTAAYALTHAPGAVQMAVLYRAPYASLLVAATHKAVDRDGDGYSPLLLGGDCDDSNPNIHPGAVDIPDNGIDENCTGEDTHVYVPPRDAPHAPYPTPLPQRANIILMQLDATRPDHTSLAGYKRKTTTRLDQFAETATWFTHAYTPAPTTRFAMASMFTGLDVDRIPQRRGPGINFTLLPAANTFAERLSASGYDAMGYTISYVLQHHISQGQGFRQWTTPWPVAEWESSYGKDAPMTTDAGIEYLSTVPQDGTRPYLLFLHYRCTHDPYIKHAEWDYGDESVDKYDSAMAFCDQHIGRMLDAVDARGDKGRTAIIIFSDHGELFGEHGLTAHGNSLYEPDVRILLVARIPGATVRKVDQRVSLMDISPTVLELASLPPDPASPAWSLVPDAMGVASPNRPNRPMFLYADIIRANVHFEARGVVDGPYKYIHDVNANVNMLFDIEHDHDEATNLVDVLPKVRGRMAEMLDSWEAYARGDGSQIAPPYGSPMKGSMPWHRYPQQPGGTAQ